MLSVSEGRQLAAVLPILRREGMYDASQTTRGHGITAERAERAHESLVRYLIGAEFYTADLGAKHARELDESNPIAEPADLTRESEV